MAEREIFEEEEEIEVVETPPIAATAPEPEKFPWKSIFFFVLVAAVVWVAASTIFNDFTIGRLEEQMTEQVDKVDLLASSVTDLKDSVGNLNAVVSSHEETLASLRSETARVRSLTSEALEKAIVAGKTGVAAERIARAARKEVTALATADSVRHAAADSVWRTLSATVTANVAADSVRGLELSGVDRRASAALTAAAAPDTATARRLSALEGLLKKQIAKAEKAKAEADKAAKAAKVATGTH